MRVPYMLSPVLPDPDLVLRDVEEILASGWLTKGPLVTRYERALADRLGVRNVVATASCTTGLILVFRALGLDGPVILPSFTFMATAHAVVWAGGSPVFADVTPTTFTLDPRSVEDSLTAETTAIIAVPVFGVPCQVDELSRIASEAGIPLVFDSAHGIGSAQAGQPLGGHGVAEVFSTSPTKTLVTGEGGFVATNDDELASTVRVLLEYGNDGSHDAVVPGLNGRMPEINASLGLRGLEVLDESLRRRMAIVDGYRAGLADVAGIRLQHVPDGCVGSYKDFTIVVEDDFPLSRDDLAESMARRGIETRKYFSPAVHSQRAYRHLDVGHRLPVTEMLERQVLSLPLWVGMQPEQVDLVLDAIVEESASGRSLRPIGSASA